MIGPYFYLLRCSLKNALLAKVRRLKQPKYAIALIVGLAYFFFIFGFNVLRAMFAKPPATAVPPVSPEWFDWGAIVAGVVYLTYIWALKGGGPGLFFKASELHYLFTAPLTRRQIVHYHILRAQPGILFSMLVIGLFALMRMSTRRPLYPMVAWYVLFNIILLHGTAAALVRASVFQHGKAGIRRHARGILIFGLIAGIIIWQSSGSPISQLMRSGAVEDLFRRVLDAPVAFIATFPLRVLGRLLFSHDFGTFLLYLAPALGVLALHYVWVIRTDVAFEEASQERSREVAERIEHWRKGKLWSRPVQRGRKLRPPFRLRPSGPVWTAIFWKNLTAATRLPALPVLISVALAGFAASIALSSPGWERGVYAIPAFVIALVASVFFFAGPGVFRNDLRRDLSCLDILKALPVSGVQMIVGQILAPLAILCSIQMLLCPLGIFFLVMAGALPVGAGVALLATIVVLYPAYAALWLLVENALVLYFPDWASSLSGPRQGIESMGERILYLVILVAAVGALLLPAAVIAGVGVVLGLLLVGSQAWAAIMVVMGWVAAAILAGECFVFVKFLGRKYETFDFATECTARDAS